MSQRNPLSSFLLIGLLSFALGPARADLPVQARSLNSVWTEPSQLQDGVELWYPIPGGPLVHGVTEGGRVTLRPGTSGIPEDPEPQTRSTSWGGLKNKYRTGGEFTDLEARVAPKILAVTEVPSFPVEEGFLYIDGSNAVNQHGATHWSAIIELDYNRFMSGDTLKVVLVPDHIELQLDGSTAVDPEHFRNVWDIGEGQNYDEFTGFDPRLFPTPTYKHTSLGADRWAAVQTVGNRLMENTTIPRWSFQVGSPTAPPFTNVVQGTSYFTNTSFNGEFVTYAVVTLGGTYFPSIAHEILMRAQTNNDACHNDVYGPACTNQTAGPEIPEDDAYFLIANRDLLERVNGNQKLASKDYRGTLN